MRTNESQEILRELLNDNAPLDIDPIPLPEQRQELSSYLEQEREKFVAIDRVRGRKNERDLSR
jgi:hypothetical protein